MGYRILVISEYFAPAMSIASVRWTKLVKYLVKDFEYKIDLLTNHKDYTGKKIWLPQYSLDNSLLSDLEYVSNHFTIDTSYKGTLSCLMLHLIRVMRDSGVKFIKCPTHLFHNNKQVTKISNVQSTSSFASNLKKNARTFFIEMIDHSYEYSKLPSGIDISDYDVIISTFAPKWTHFIARWIKEKNCKVIWLADYRDPLYNHAYLNYNMNKSENSHFAESVTGNATCILGVSDGCLQNLFIDKDIPQYVVPNGFDGTISLQSRKPMKTFDFVYTGSLYSNGSESSNLVEIASSISRLVELRKIENNDIRVIYAGITPDLYDDQVRQFESRFTSINLGVISRSEALKLQHEASILIFLTWNTPSQKGVVTGKIFEYMSSGTPIVGYVSGSEPNAIATEMIERSHTGICIEEARLEESRSLLDDFIAEKYEEWKTKGFTTVNPDIEYIETFSYANRARQVDGIIKKYIGDRGHDE